MQTITTEKQLEGALNPLLDNGSPVEFKIINGDEIHEYAVSKLDEVKAECAGGRRCVSHGVAEFEVNCAIESGDNPAYENYNVCAMCVADEIAVFSGV